MKLADLQFVGDCRNEDLVDEIFGSVSEFARQVEINGDNFVFNGIRVKYIPQEDIHQFYEA